MAGKESSPIKKPRKRTGRTGVSSRTESSYNRSLIEASLDPLVTIGPDGRITDVNEATTRATGVGREDLIGTDFSGYFTDPGAAKSGYEKVFREGSVRDYELVLKHRDGREVPVLYNASVFRDVDGRVAGVFAAARDITDLRNVEQALMQLNRGLEEKVQVRTAELLEANRTLQAEIAERKRAEEEAGRKNEELGTVNEELFAMGEELRRTNENLVRSEEDLISRNDELGALNEELAATQKELRHNNDEMLEAEQQLRETSQYLDSLLDYANAPIIVWDPDLRITRFNHAFERLTGMTSGDVLGHSLAILFPDDLKDGIMMKIRGTLAGDQWESAEIPVRTVSGGVRTVLWNSAGIYYPDGKTVRSVIAQGQDITDRKQVEEALRERENQLRFIFDNSPDYISLQDSSQRYIQVSRPLPGLTRDLYIGRTDPEVAAFLGIPESGQELFAIKQKVMDENRGRTIETCIGTGGRQYTFRSSFEPWRDESGKVIGVAGYMHDITERRDAGEALKRANDRLEHRVLERTAELKAALDSLEKERHRLTDVLETLPAYVCLLSPDYRMPFANRYFRESFGYDPARCCYDFLFSRDRPCENCETFTVMKTRAPHHWYWTGPNGRDYDIYDYPFTGSDGTPMILEMGIDITEQNRALAELERSRSALEERVRGRTAELQVLVERLKQSNNELEQFAYIASHDLREPLRMVTIYSQLLEERYRGRLDHDADEFIGYIVDGGIRMDALVNDLLDFSRVSSRAKPFEPADMNGIVGDVISGLSVAVRESGARIEAGNLPVIAVDRSQLAQVFQNLIANAIKFRKEGQHPRIAIGGEIRDGVWMFSVKDNGIGIDPAYSDKIFEIFKRLHPVDRYPGTGIGLAICKRIIERHNGRIWVESEEGCGSTFFFTLPEANGR